MISFRFFKMKVYCVFILKSSHQGDSNEYTQYTFIQYEKEKHPKLSKIYNHLIFFLGTQE